MHTCPFRSLSTLTTLIRRPATSLERGTTRDGRLSRRYAQSLPRISERNNVEIRFGLKVEKYFSRLFIKRFFYVNLLKNKWKTKINKIKNKFLVNALWMFSFLVTVHKGVFIMKLKKGNQILIHRDRYRWYCKERETVIRGIEEEETEKEWKVRMWELVAGEYVNICPDITLNVYLFNALVKQSVIYIQYKPQVKRDSIRRRYKNKKQSKQ